MTQKITFSFPLLKAQMETWYAECPISTKTTFLGFSSKAGRSCLYIPQASATEREQPTEIKAKLCTNVKHPLKALPKGRCCLFPVFITTSITLLRQNIRVQGDMSFTPYELPHSSFLFDFQFYYYIICIHNCHSSILYHLSFQKQLHAVCLQSTLSQ